MEMGINKYTAYNVINSLDKRYLSNIIKIFGEEKGWEYMKALHQNIRK